MSRKSVYIGLGLVTLLLTGAAVAVVLLVRYQPDFYGQVAVEAGPYRKKCSADFKDLFARFMNDMINHDERAVEFTEEQINSYFEEDFARSGLAQKVLPETMTAPRIRIEPDRIRLGCRYSLSELETVLSLDLRMWLATQEPNVLALEIQGLYAGALPISAQSLLERISEAAPQDMEVSWYRHKGNPVAILRFQADKKRPTMMLRHLELQEGKILIAGGPIETYERAHLRHPVLTLTDPFRH
jgi:hypothetical protein